MKGILAGVLAVLLIVAVSGAQNHFGWSLSESLTDPCVTTGVPTFALKNIYLWHTYNTGLPVVAVELTDGVSGSIAPFAFTPASPWQVPVGPDLPTTVIGFTGWSSDGSAPCRHYVNGMAGCLGPVSVDASSWGSVKALYR